MSKKKLLMMLLFLTGAAVRAHAEATFELTGDFGFWQPPGSCTPGCPNPIAWPTGIPNISVPNDPSAPEGQKIFRFQTSLPGGTGIVTNGGMDLSAYAGGSLRFWMKTTMNMNIEIEDSTPPNANIVLNNTGGQWQQFEIPFSSFGGGSIDFTDIRSVFLAYGVNLAGGYSAEFDDIRWTKPVTGLAVYPKVVDVNFNSRRQFTVEGYDAFGESIFLYSTFNNAFPIGSFSPFNPSAPPQVQSSLFTAGAAGGNLNFSYLALSTAALVNNTFNNLNRQWGLLSETIPGIVLNTDSFLGTAVGSGGGNVQINATTADKREGNESTFVSLNAPANGFAGFFIQHGLAPSGDFVTKDMSHYFDGSLRFWFKGPPALQPILEIGIRSGNVRAGRELSKALLANYVAFDNQWHSVVIPLTDFAGPRPFADLARTKVYVSFFAVGNTGGPQGIYIDNLRYDSTRPGPLARIDLLPSPVMAPLGSNRIIRAQGYDAAGSPVDVFPNWSLSGPVGTINPTSGINTVLSAVTAPASGSITATQGSISSTTVVTVADPAWTQSTNIYSDLGSGGYVGVAQNIGTTMNLTEISGGAPEGTTLRRANGTLQLAGGGAPGFAVWFTNVDGANGTRFMNAYSDGYLHFWVKTARDLQISVRSANIAPGTELSKIWLSDLGVPLNNQFQRVIIPMADFRALEPMLDFTQIQTFFAITALTSRGGANAYTFDVDDVKWLTSSATVPDQAKVLAGLLAKQNASGLVRSYDTLPRAVTYDQALAAMAFTFNQHYAEAQNIFNVYLTKFNAGGFAGFHEEYDVVNPSTIIDSDRIAGPNAWMLLALLHYRNVRGATAASAYDGMTDGLANWLLSLQDPGDGAIRYGFASLHPNEKSTEHNFDCYSAFRAYADARNNNTFRTAANNIANWLQTQMYVPAQVRFNVGEYGATGLPNTDRALDAYSWAPLAMASYADVLNTAVVDLSTAQICALTGNLIQGFDFSGSIGQPVDKDAVWIEGTAQMAVAYYMTGNSALGDFYANELDKAIVNVSPTTQGLPYATNAGTAYGFTMDPSNPSASSAAWYLFMKQRFNPLQPSGAYGITVKNISNNQVSPTVGFTANVPTNWVRSDQYIEIFTHPISIAPWGLQIYTNNSVSNALPRYIDPTPGNTINPDSDPAGLGWLRTGVSTTSFKLPLSWRVQDSSAPVPSAIAPYTVLNGGSGQQFNWAYMKDRATPAIDANGNGVVGDPVDGTAFQDAEEYVIVKDTRGIHSSQGSSGFVPSFSPDYIFLQADFGYAAYQQTYQSNTISLEFYFQ